LKLVDLLRELDADRLLGDLLPVESCVPYEDEADLVSALYVLAARDARTLTAGETDAHRLVQAIFHLPGFCIASASKRYLFPYVAMLVHRYFLSEGGLAGDPERRRRLARLLFRKWIKEGGERPRASHNYVQQLMAWLIDNKEPECKNALSLVDKWAEGVRTSADKMA
jgi:hypothetical protein